MENCEGKREMEKEKEGGTSEPIWTEEGREGGWTVIRAASAAAAPSRNTKHEEGGKCSLALLISGLRRRPLSCCKSDKWKSDLLSTRPPGGVVYRKGEEGGRPLLFASRLLFSIALVAAFGATVSLLLILTFPPND